MDSNSHAFQQYSRIIHDEDASLEDTDFSETINFITQILMEEEQNFDHRPFYDPLSLQITQKSFHDALSPNQQQPLHGKTNTSSNNSNYSSIKEDSITLSPYTPVSDLVNHDFQFNSSVNFHTCSKPNSTGVSDGLIDFDSSITNLLAQNIFSNADSVSQFNRGFEEANKFLPPQPQLVTGLDSSNFNIVKGRKTRECDEGYSREEEEDRRSNKQSAISVVDDDDELSEMFDQILLNVENDYLPNEKQSSANGRKACPKKRDSKNETIDLTNLLLQCSQALHANENRNVNELLKQIRQHSSPFGDASQRVAHYFANGIEARLVGNGAGVQTFYSSPNTKRITAAEFLKAYQVHFISPPFKKFAYLFVNEMIMKVAEKAETLHIIDFGILYGFQWPMLIKFLSNREGGPPKLRITGIEFPLPGFRPTDRIEETGRRLANYCKCFNVPFEYNAIASRNWEKIRVEDLKIESNEVIAVNCLRRFKNLLDESVEVNSPRNAVLDLIRKINPDIFTLTVINGSYNSPFFSTRFREALFNYSAIYDMFDSVIPRENEWRTMIEREIIGREVMNVVACEGLERVERPETYKMWQVRITKAGFKQLPLDSELMAKFRIKLRQWYHRDFVFDEDNNWMLQGWKGRILYASTCWVPA